MASSRGLTVGGFAPRFLLLAAHALDSEVVGAISCNIALLPSGVCSSEGEALTSRSSGHAELIPLATQEQQSSIARRWQPLSAPANAAYQRTICYHVK